MAIALVLGIGDLIPEFLTHTLILLRPFQTAWAVATGALETLPDHPDYFFVFI